MCGQDRLCIHMCYTCSACVCMLTCMCVLICVYMHRHTIPCVCESMITYAHSCTTHALHVCACLHMCAHTDTHGPPPLSAWPMGGTCQALFLIHNSSLLTLTLTRISLNIAEVTKGTYVRAEKQVWHQKNVSKRESRAHFRFRGSLSPTQPRR